MLLKLEDPWKTTFQCSVNCGQVPPSPSSVPPSPSLEKEVHFQLLRLVYSPVNSCPLRNFCFGRKPQIVSMVRPTVTKDVPSCNNRFAALDENYYESLNRRTLQGAGNLQGKPPPPLRLGGAASQQLTTHQLISMVVAGGLSLE